MKLNKIMLAIAATLAVQVSADTLYDRLGGEQGVYGIASDLLDKSASDPVTRRSLEKVNMKRLKQLIGEQFCQLTGGPCRYSGDTMKQSHAGLGITETEFYGLVGHLRAVLDARGIAQADKNALLAILAPMKRDVVDSKP